MRRKGKIISLILALVMLLSCIPAYADYVDIVSGGSNSNSGAPLNGDNVWNKNAQFIRVTLWFTENGTNKPIRVGNTVDWAASNAGPVRPVVNHGKFIPNSEYNRGLKWKEGNPCQYDLGVYYYGNNLYRGETKESPKTDILQFPIVFGKVSGENLNNFFKQYEVYNQVLYMAQANFARDNITEYGGKYPSKLAVEDPKNEHFVKKYMAWQNVDNLMTGKYEGRLDRLGNQKIKYGTYHIELDVGIYANMGGKYTAATLREIVQMNDKVRSGFWSTRADMAMGSYIEKSYKNLGLGGNSSIDQVKAIIPSLTASNTNTKGKTVNNNLNLINDRMGVGVVEFVPKMQGKHTVTSYMYTLNKDENVKYESAYDAVLGKPDKVYQQEIEGNQYKYPLTTENGKYTLQEVFLYDKNELKATLKVNSNSNEVKLVDLTGTEKVTNEAEKQIEQMVVNKGLVSDTKEVIENVNKNKFESYPVARGLVTDLKNANSKAKTTQKNDIFKFTADGMTITFGHDLDSLQAVALYTDKPLGVPDYDDTTSKKVGRFTHVSTFVFDGEDDPNPIISREVVQKDEPYELEAMSEVVLKLVEWDIVEDKVINKADYDDWESMAKGSIETGTNPKVFPADTWNNPDTELYIKYIKNQTVPPVEVPDNQGKTAKLELTEKRISKGYDLTVNGTQSLTPITFKRGSAGVHFHKHDGCNCAGLSGGCKGHTCEISTGVETALNYVVQNHTKGNELNNSIIGETSIFSYITKNYHLSGNDSYVAPESAPADKASLSPNIDFVVWRGDDKPTIASYKQASKHELTGVGLEQDRIPKTARKQIGSTVNEGKSYIETGVFKIDKTDSFGGQTGDYEASFKDHKGCGTGTQTHSSKGSAVYNMDTTVHQYLGDKNDGLSAGKNSLNGQSFSIRAVNGNNYNFDKTKTIIKQAENPIQLYPYVQMAYDTPAKKNIAVNVLANHLSQINNSDAVDIGWISAKGQGNSKALEIKSNQWSTHQASKGSTQVLPGGAIYSLNTNQNIASRQKVGAVIWQTEITDRTNKEVLVNVNDKLTHGKQNNIRYNMIQNMKTALDQIDVKLWVGSTGTNKETDKNPFKTEIQMYLSNPMQKVDNIALTKDKKYILARSTPITSKNANEADLDSKIESQQTTYFVLKSDVNGNVSFIKVGTDYGTAQALADGKTGGCVYNLTVPKTASAADMLAYSGGATGISASQASAIKKEMKVLEDKTGAITNFFSAIDRNKGNDATVGNGPEWYNEAIDGVIIAKTEVVYDLGFGVEGGKDTARTAALDPKLCPVIDSATNIYTKFRAAAFKLNATSFQYPNVSGKIGEFNGLDIIVPDMTNMLHTQMFRIPNATVMNLN